MAEEIPPSQMSEKLRSMILDLDPKDIGLTKENYPHPVFAIIMETSFEEGSFTLSSIGDGSTSLYLSHGGGVIGGAEHENVREASNLFLSDAQDYFEKAKSVTSFPKPEIGMVVFYFITIDGVRSYIASEDSLSNKHNEFSQLYFAAHNVITELRKIDED